MNQIDKHGIGKGLFVIILVGNLSYVSRKYLLEMLEKMSIGFRILFMKIPKYWGLEIWLL